MQDLFVILPFIVLGKGSFGARVSLCEGQNLEPMETTMRVSIKNPQPSVNYIVHVQEKNTNQNKIVPEILYDEM